MNQVIGVPVSDGECAGFKGRHISTLRVALALFSHCQPHLCSALACE